MFTFLLFRIAGGNMFIKKSILFFSLLSLQIIYSQNYQNLNFGKGLQHFYSLQFDQAIPYFQMAIKENIDFLPAYQKLIKCNKALGTLSSAQAYFEMIKNDHPEHSLPLYALALINIENQNYVKAIEYLQYSIKLKPLFYENIFKLIESFARIKKIDVALQFMEKRVKENPEDSFSNYGLAIVQFFKNRNEKALTILNTALKLNPQLLDAYRLMAIIFRDRLGNLKKAQAVCDTAISIAQQLNDSEFLIDFFLLKATILLNAGKPTQAIELCQEAVEESERAYLIDRKAEALSNLGVIYRQSGKNEQALNVLKQSAQIFRALHDRMGEQKVISNLGDLFLTTGMMDSAQVFYKNALQLAQKVQEVKDIAASYGQLATLYFYLGNFKQSASYSDSAIYLYRKINYKPGLTTELGNLGTVFYVLGQYWKALKYFDDAQKQAVYLGDKYLQEINLGNMGSIYVLLQDYSHAQKYLQKAYQIAHEISSPSDEASWLGALSSAQLALGDTAKAIQSLKNSLSILKTVNDWRNVAITLANLGTIFTLQKQYQLAENYFQQAFEINNNIHNTYAIAETHNNLGTLYLKQKKYDLARRQFQIALEQGEKLSSPKTIWEAQYGLGQVNEKSKNLKAAMANYKQAIETIESIRGELVQTELKTSFLSGKVQVYYQLIDLLFRLFKKNKDPKLKNQAFYFAEKAKARTLLDLLTESRIEIKKGVDPKLLQAEKRRLQNISQIQTRLSTEPLTAEEIRTLTNRLEDYEDKLNNIRAEIRKGNPSYAQLKFPSVVTLKQVQASLTKDEYLLEFILSKTNSYLWLISKDKCEWVQLPGQKTLVFWINRYLKVLSQPPGISAPLNVYGQKLTKLLLGPVLTQLPDKAHLIIIPDGELHYLPFETLILSNSSLKRDYFIEHYSIHYASSASVALFLKQRLQPSNYAFDLLAFGDPVFASKDSTSNLVEQFYTTRGLRLKRLFHSSQEVESIAQLFPQDRTRLYLRSLATEENMKAEDGTLYRIIHFATHGMIDEKNPGRSCIVLTIDTDPTEDGFLQVQEIFDLKLKAQLVTLSACQTGKGKLVRGEGVVGFAQAFYYSGAQSLLLSLWPVTDQSTALLMRNFYSFLEKSYSAPEALRKAKLKFIHNSNRSLRHPYYWAPFVLRGGMGLNPLKR